ncbi:uro-adherence factor A [Procambarus clarkii]|uniref:uro-adherence factor A n=1 Tax=Procambarus clarkii TaxID=6728 RepID=UPI0037437A80
MTFEAQVADQLHYKYLFADLPKDAWPRQVLVRVYLRLLCVYDSSFENSENDPGETAGSSNSIHRSFVHIHRCLRLLGIDHLAPKIKDLSDKARALRIISAIDDKIISRYGLEVAARRNRVLIKKEQMKTSKMKSLPEPTKKLNEDDANSCDVSTVSSSPPKGIFAANCSVTTQEKWLMVTRDSPTSDLNDEDIIPLTKGRQLPRTPVKRSIIPGEERKVSSENTGNINADENFVEVADSDEIPIDSVDADLNIIPTGKQIPRTPNVQDENNLNTEKDEKPVGIHDVTGHHNIIQESIEECEQKEGSSDILLLPPGRRKLLRENVSEQCPNGATTQLSGCENYQLELKTSKHIAVLSSGLQSKSDETCIPKRLDETCVPMPVVEPYIPKPLGETCIPTPSDETYVPTPLDNTYVPTPLDDSYVPMPVDDTSVPTPLDETYVPKPLDETYVPTPLDETYVPNPLDETYVPAPVDETYVPAPVDETYVPTPVDETYVPAPLDQTYVPAPLDQTYIHKRLDETFVATSLNATYIIAPPLEYKASTPDIGCRSNPTRSVRTQENYFLHESLLSEYFEPSHNCPSSTRSKKSLLTSGNGATIKHNTMKSNVYIEKCSRESNEFDELSVSMSKGKLELKLPDRNTDASQSLHGAKRAPCILTPPIGFKDQTFSSTEGKLISKVASNEHPVQQDECTLPYLDIQSKDVSVKQYIANEDYNSFGQLLPKISSVDENKIVGRDDLLTNSSTYKSSTSLHSVVNLKDTEVSKSICNDDLISQTVMETSETSIKDELISEEPSVKLEVSPQDGITAAYSSISSDNPESSIHEVEFNDSLDIFPLRIKEMGASNRDIISDQTKVYLEGVEGATENATKNEEGDSLKVNIKSQTKLRIPKKIKIKSSNSLKNKIKRLADENDDDKMDEDTEVTQKSQKRGSRFAEVNALHGIRSDNSEQSEDDEALFLEGTIKTECKENCDMKDKLVSDCETAKQFGNSKITRANKREAVSKTAESVTVDSGVLNFKTKLARKQKTKIPSNAALNKDIKEFENSTNEDMTSEISAKNIEVGTSANDASLAISTRSTRTKEKTRGTKLITNKLSKIEEGSSKVLSVTEEVEKSKVATDIKSRFNVTGSNIDDLKCLETVQSKVQLKENPSVPVLAVKPKKSAKKAASGVQKEENLKPNSRLVNKSKRLHKEEILDQIQSQTSSDEEQMEMKEDDCIVSSSRSRIRGKRLLKLPSAKLSDICEDLQSLCMEPGNKFRSQISVGREPTTKLGKDKTKVNNNAEQSIESLKIQPEDEIGMHLQALSLDPIEKSSLESHKEAGSVLHHSSIPKGKPGKKISKAKKISENPSTITDVPVLDTPARRGNQRRACQNRSFISQKKVLGKDTLSPSHDQSTPPETKVEKRGEKLNSGRRVNMTVCVEKENVPTESSNANESGAEDQKLKKKNTAAKKRSRNNKSLLENLDKVSSPLRVQSGRRCKAKALTAISEIFNDSDSAFLTDIKAYK